MSLANARPMPGERLPELPAGPPYPAAALTAWAGRRFRLPAGDPRLPALYRGEAAPAPALDNLLGAAHAWADHPAYMDLLDPASPSHSIKMVEREIYLDRWRPHLPPPGASVLDLGGGVGRFTSWFLDRGDRVTLVDPDLRSLWRGVWGAAGRDGLFDAYWSTGEALPPLAPVSVVVASEMLCYTDAPERVLENVAAALEPGGLLLCSVEARWGWVFAQDVPEGTVEQWLETGIVHVPGDRWVHTFERDEFHALLSPLFDVAEILPTHYAVSGPFEAAAGLRGPEGTLALEARLRAHPVAGRLNRAWTAVARRR